jgi:hypothetical protein
MQSGIVGRAEVKLGFQIDRDTGENETAKRIVPFGIGIAVVRPIASRGVADD